MEFQGGSEPRACLAITLKNVATLPWSGSLVTQVMGARSMGQKEPGHCPAQSITQCWLPCPSLPGYPTPKQIAAWN